MAKTAQLNSRTESNGYIALLLPELRIGGAQKVFLTLAKNFIELGLTVDLIVMANEGELLNEIPQGVRLIALSKKHFSRRIHFLPILILKFIRYLRQCRPDALLSTLTGTNLFAVIAHSFANVETRLVIREAAPLANLQRSYLVFFMRYLYEKADSVVVLTDYMKKEMEDKLKIDPCKIHQISNPIDLKKIKEAAMEPLPKDFDYFQPYAIAVGRLAPQKDYLTLIEAFTEVGKNTSLRLVILGEGPDRNILEARIRELALCDKVELRGFEPNPYRWVGRSSVFVMSSRWEGYPNAMLEALALKIPIVSTLYDTSVKDLLINQKACLVPVGDPVSIAEAISRIIGEACVPLNTALPNGVQNATSDYLHVLNCSITTSCNDI